MSVPGGEASPSPPAVEVAGLAKAYARDLRRAQRNGLAEIFGELLRSPEPRSDPRAGEFWAVRDVSFQVRRGEALGIVGRNGAGKSTLLRLAAGITRPTVGDITRRGRVATLLDPSAGFNLLLSGRENAEVAYTLLAGERPVAATLASISDFAGIAEAMDHPVRTYSQGMRLRLAFSTIVHVEPEILMIDEALAVGDAAFQLQCLDYLRSFIRSGGSIIFVSHSLWVFQTLATRGIHLEGGQVVLAGSPSEVADDYVAELKRGSWVDAGDGPDLMDRERLVVVSEPSLSDGSDDVAPAAVAEEGEMADPVQLLRPVSFVEVEVTGDDGGPPTLDGSMEIRFELASREPIAAAELAFTIWTADLSVCLIVDRVHDLPAPAEPASFAIGSEGTQVTCRIDRLPVAAGSYAVRAAVYDDQTSDVLAMVGFEDAPIWFEVQDPEQRPTRPSNPDQLRPLRTLHAECIDEPSRVLPTEAPTQPMR